MAEGSVSVRGGQSQRGCWRCSCGGTARRGRLGRQTAARGWERACTLVAEEALFGRGVHFPWAGAVLWPVCGGSCIIERQRGLYAALRCDTTLLAM